MDSSHHLLSFRSLPLPSPLPVYWRSFSTGRCGDWAGISSFGNRFFVSLTAIFIFGLALFLDYFAALFSRRWLAISVSCVGLACLVIWNLGMIYQWGVHLIPARGPISFRQAADNQFHAVPSEISSQLRSYLLHRGELMRQIEQKDIEQMKNNSHP